MVGLNFACPDIRIMQKSICCPMGAMEMAEGPGVYHGEVH
jgi:hypothetical protein